MEEFAINLAMRVCEESEYRAPTLNALVIVGRTRDEGRPFQVRLIPQEVPCNGSQWSAFEANGVTNYFFYGNPDMDKSVVTFDDDSSFTSLGAADVLFRDFVYVDRIVLSEYSNKFCEDHPATCILVPTNGVERARSVTTEKVKIVLESGNGGIKNG